MDANYLVVLVTIADAEAGVALGRKLVEEALAACVQVIPGGTAIYRWQGRLNTDAQVQLIIKTRRAVWPRLRERIVELHGDEVPEILALSVVDGLPAYLRWLDEGTTPDWLAVQPRTEVRWRDYAEVYPRVGIPFRVTSRSRRASRALSSKTGVTSSSTCRHRTGAASGATR